jgi:magnesium chelatase subunit D
VADLAEPAERAEAVRRRLAFEADPEAFVAAWRGADAEEAKRIQRAQGLLPRVVLPAGVLDALIARCLGAGVEGLRADLTLSRAACAWAAYQGRTEVSESDLDAVAELALAHRRTKPPEPPDGPGSNRQPSKLANYNHRPEAQARELSIAPRAGAHAEILPSAGLYQALVRPPARMLAKSALRGRWMSSHPDSGRKRARLRSVHQPDMLLAWAPTLRAAALYQKERRRQESERLILRGDDLRSWQLRKTAGCLLLFLLDTSGSMAAWQRMRQTKAAVLALLTQAYRQRDRIALLAFHDSAVDLVLPPRRGIGLAREALEALPAGGTTPLAAGLAACRRLIRSENRKDPRVPIWTILLTDGRANAAAAGDPWQEALREARRLALAAPHCLVVDTETGCPRFGRARELAHVLGAEHLPLEEVLGRPLRLRPSPIREVAS